MFIKQTTSTSAITKRVKLMLGALCALTLTVGAIPASAQINATTVNVRIMKYELSTKNGVSRVYKRLEKKARTSCETPGQKALSVRTADQKCATKLLDSFVADLANPRVTKYHEQVTHQ